MILRLVLLFLMFTSSYAKESNWYDGIDVKLEAGLFLSDYDGTVSNPNSKLSFKDDLGYSSTTSSNLGLEFKFPYEYMPNIALNYFNMKQNRDSNISTPFEVIGVEMTTPITSRIDYRVLNTKIHQEFKRKGKRQRMYGFIFYPGDIEFDVGINIKVIDYLFQVKPSAESDDSYRFESVRSITYLPHIGVKYYRYDLSLYANISALSLSSAKAKNYQYGVIYKVIDNLYIDIGYMYEDFQATEKRDSINFKTSGYKYSFKYAF